MTPNRLKAEIRRRANKTSYQGPGLERRIRKQMKIVERDKELERWAKHEWLERQLRIMISEDELSLMLAIQQKALS